MNFMENKDLRPILCHTWENPRPGDGESISLKPNITHEVDIFLDNNTCKF